MVAKSSAWEMVIGGSITRLVTPISAAVLSFFFTYETDAGSSPTRTSARHGLRPASAATSAFNSATMAAAIWFPSIRSMEDELPTEHTERDDSFRVFCVFRGPKFCLLQLQRLDRNHDV